MLLLLAYLVVLYCTWSYTVPGAGMTFTQEELRDLISRADIKVSERGRLYAFVNTCFPVAQQATTGVPPKYAVATLLGYFRLPAGKLVARLLLLWVQRMLALSDKMPRIGSGRKWTKHI